MNDEHLYLRSVFTNEDSLCVSCIRLILNERNVPGWIYIEMNEVDIFSFPLWLCLCVPCRGRTGLVRPVPLSSVGIHDAGWNVKNVLAAAFSSLPCFQHTDLVSSFILSPQFYLVFRCAEVSLHAPVRWDGRNTVFNPLCSTTNHTGLKETQHTSTSGSEDSKAFITCHSNEEPQVLITTPNYKMIRELTSQTFIDPQLTFLLLL